MEITDCLISLEHEELHLHEDATASNRCVKKTLAGDWIVSNFVIQSKERHDLLSRLKRQIRAFFGLRCFNGTFITITIILAVLMYLLDTAMPYYDSYLDASV
jgi:hypothetical protein